MDLVELVRNNIRKWGQWAALRHAKKNRVPFVCAYVAVFGVLPRKSYVTA
jgi:hypothetical protein